MRRDAEATETTAVDLAEALVRDGVPFREAHAAVATAVRLAASAGSAWPTSTPESWPPSTPPLPPPTAPSSAWRAAWPPRPPPAPPTPRVGDQLAVLEVAASAARSWAAGFRPVLDLGLD